MKLSNRLKRIEKKVTQEKWVKSWTIGKRISIAFISIAIVTLIIAFVGFSGSKLLDTSIHEVGQVRLPSVQNLLEARLEAEQINAAMLSLLTPGESFKNRDLYTQSISEKKQVFQDHIDTYESLPKNDEEHVAWDQFADANSNWLSEIESFLEFAGNFDELGIEDPVDLSRQIEMFTKDHYQVVQKVLHMIHVDNEIFEGSEDPTQCNAGKFFTTFSSDNQELMDIIHSSDASHRTFHEAIILMKNEVRMGNNSNAAITYKNEFLPAMDGVFVNFEEMLSLTNQSLDMMITARDHFNTDYLPTKSLRTEVMNNATQINDKITEDVVKGAEFNAKSVQNVSLFGIFLSVGIALLLGFLVKKSINTALISVIDRLGSGAEQINVASDELSSAAQSLAESSSEQAASLEETTSSVEEISSQSKLTSINSDEAATKMKEVEPHLVNGVKAMERMNKAMSEIHESSLETSKVIRTIDDIAFQTNLLALNAAVEAARAGEAGKGFAVVAEEVRSLAQRSSEAAKNTSDLIQSSQQTSENGNAVAIEVTENLHKIEQSIKTVSTLVAEIAVAAKEQQTGIEEMTGAMHQMDTVVQANASSSEESASSAEELSSQAEELNTIVDELQKLVGIDNTDNFNSSNYPYNNFTPSVERNITTKPLSNTLLKDKLNDSLNPNYINDEKFISLVSEDDFSEF